MEPCFRAVALMIAVNFKPDAFIAAGAAEVLRMSEGSEVIVAMDSDEDGASSPFGRRRLESRLSFLTALPPVEV
jgi:hypothetical protein